MVYDDKYNCIKLFSKTSELIISKSFIFKWLSTITQASMTSYRLGPEWTTTLGSNDFFTWTKSPIKSYLDWSNSEKTNR